MLFQEFLVKKAPPTIFYLKDFISEEEEKYLIDRILTSPKPKWEFLKNRRLQNWGGILGPKGSLIQADDIPDWLHTWMDRIVQTGLFPEGNRPNHVLINEYLPGQGIMPHTDGPAFYPIVTTISLGSHTSLNFYRPVGETVDEGSPESQSESLESRYVGSMLLERRSLVVVKDQMYSGHLHGIEERLSDRLSEKIFNCPAEANPEWTRDTRYSVTIRNVPKVAKVSLIGKRR